MFATLAPPKPSYSAALRILRARYGLAHGFSFLQRGKVLVLQIEDPKAVLPVRQAQQIALDAGKALQPLFLLPSAEPMPAWGYRDCCVEFCYAMEG